MRIWQHSPNDSPRDLEADTEHQALRRRWITRCRLDSLPVRDVAISQIRAGGLVHGPGYSGSDGYEEDATDNYCLWNE